MFSRFSPCVSTFVGTVIGEHRPFRSSPIRICSLLLEYACMVQGHMLTVCEDNIHQCDAAASSSVLQPRQDENVPARIEPRAAFVSILFLYQISQLTAKRSGYQRFKRSASFHQSMLQASETSTSVMLALVVSSEEVTRRFTRASFQGSAKIRTELLSLLNEMCSG